MKHLKILSLITSLSFVSLLSACGQSIQPDQDTVTTTLDDMELKKGRQVERIRDYRVDSWRYVDAYNLIIKAGLKEQYLISLRGPCPELRNAFQIGFTSRTGTLDKFEDIVVSDRINGTRRCGISDIVKLEGLDEYPEGRPPE